MQPASKNLLFAFALVPVIAYPLYAGVFFLSDAWLGDRIILRQLHDTRRQLWNTFWADYAHALPVFYLIGALLFLLPLLIISRHRPRVPWWLPIPLGLLAGAGFGLYFSATVGWVTFLHTLTGTVLGALFSGIVRRQAT
jgi:hypothetical protein